MNGGYDGGYKACPCFWGRHPGSLIGWLENHLQDFSGLSVLDAGCGEGKNAIYMARKGCTVQAIDISKLAILNARHAWHDYDDISWEVTDIRSLPLDAKRYDVVIAYGLLHCLSSQSEVESVIRKLQGATKPGGYNVVCAFNDQNQEMEDAHPGFSPVLLSHSAYLNHYDDWQIVYETNEALHEVHPHNNVPHSHSITRLVAKRSASHELSS